MTRLSQRSARYFLAASALYALACTPGCKHPSNSSNTSALPAAVQTAPPAPLVISTQSPLPRANAGKLYLVTLQAAGGIPPYIWSIPAGDLNLPSGLTLNSNGVINGMPGDLSAAHSLFTFQVKDKAGNTATKNLELECVAPIKLTSVQPLADGNVGLPYSFDLSASGGVPPYTFGLANGSAPLPAGLTLSNQNGSGAVQGILAKPGTFPFVLRVADSGTPQLQTTLAYTLHVLKNVIIPITSLPAGVLNSPYSESIPAVGGSPPFHWEIAGDLNQLPDELVLDSSTGIVSGIPRSPGSSNLQVQVTDSAKPPSTRSQSIQLIINGPLAVQSFSLPDAARASFYHASVIVVGGRPPYVARLARGKLPAGLSIESSAGSIVVSGVPLVDGVFDSTIRISDSFETPNSITREVQIRISEPLAISQTDMPSSVVQGQQIAAAFSATGGIPPYTWTMNNVPAGLTFDTATGALTGIPTGNSNFSAVVTVRDSSNPPLSASTTFSMHFHALLRPCSTAALGCANSLKVGIGNQAVAPSSTFRLTNWQKFPRSRSIHNGRKVHTRSPEIKSAREIDQRRRHPNG